MLPQRQPQQQYQIHILQDLKDSPLSFSPFPLANMLGHDYHSGDELHQDFHKRLDPLNVNSLSHDNRQLTLQTLLPSFSSPPILQNSPGRLYVQDNKRRIPPYSTWISDSPSYPGRLEYSKQPLDTYLNRPFTMESNFLDNIPLRTRALPQSDYNVRPEYFDNNRFYRKEDRGRPWNSQTSYLELKRRRKRDVKENNKKKKQIPVRKGDFNNKFLS
ncbi:unnamed protein product, partial [Didymodactylos carnosus]